MDSKPFFEINMLDFNEAEVEELRRFSKTSYNLEQILSTAKDLKYSREIKRLLASEWSEPSESFVRYVAGQVYDGPRTKAIIDQFSRITRQRSKRERSRRSPSSPLKMSGKGTLRSRRSSRQKYPRNA